jgi:Cupin
LLTRGQPYCTGSDPKLNPGDGRKVLASRICPDGIVRYGKAGERMSAAGGRFIFDDDTSDLLLPLLPPLVHVPAASDSAAPLRAVLELLRLETEAVRPGALVKADPDSKQADASARATA